MSERPEGYEGVWPPSARRYGLEEIRRQVRYGYHPGATEELLEMIDERDVEIAALRSALDQTRARLADLEPKYAALSVEIQAHDEASDPVPSERDAAILAAAEAMAGAWETTGYTGHWSRMKTAVDVYRALVPAPSTPKE